MGLASDDVVAEKDVLLGDAGVNLQQIIIELPRIQPASYWAHVSN